MSQLSDLLKGIGTTGSPTAHTTPMFAGNNYQLPYGGGTYNNSSVTPAPVVPPGPVVKPAPASMPQKGTAPQGTTAAPTQSQVNPEFVKPDGTYYTAQEVVNNRVARMKTGKADVPVYAGNAMENPNQSVEQMNKQAYGMNNARNDIATGTTDPYKTGSKSGIAYSPAELKAIEKAYAGIYDPALTDVFSKLDAKKKEDELAATRKYDLEKLAQEHKYRLAEAAQKAGSGTSSNGTTYTAGQDPVVDGWVERLNRTGENIQTAIPGVANQGLRNKVMLGLNANKFKSAQTLGNLDSINTINDMLTNPELENISGTMDQYTGGIFGKAKTAKTQYDQIAGLLQLAKAGSVKGQGAISDYERKMLKEGAAAMDRGMSDEDFRKALVKVRGVYMTASGLEAPVRITDPTTGESQVQNLSTHEIEDFIRDGARIEYVEQ